MKSACIIPILIPHLSKKAAYDRSKEVGMSEKLGVPKIIDGLVQGKSIHING